jgi:hypothetical protein
MLHRHATDVVALVSGTIFAGLAAVWLLIITEAVDVEQAWIGGPVILIVAGVLGLLVTLTPNRDVLPATGYEPPAEPAGATQQEFVADPEDLARTTPIDVSDEEPTSTLTTELERSDDDPDR